MKPKIQVKNISIFLLLILAMIVPVGVVNAANGFVMESRHVAGIGPYWKTVKLGRKFNSPVIVCSKKTKNNASPITTRIRNIMPGSFELKLQSLTNESVVPEDVEFIATEKGQWTLTENCNMEAYSLKAREFNKKDGIHTFLKSVPLTRYFKNPVVVTTVNDRNNTVPIVANVFNITPSSFKLQLKQPLHQSIEAEDVNIIVAEEGIWPVGNNRFIEARKQNNTFVNSHRLRRNQ